MSSESNKTADYEAFGPKMSVRINESQVAKVQDGIYRHSVNAPSEYTIFPIIYDSFV